MTSAPTHSDHCFADEVRVEIYRSFIDEQCAPTVEELARSIGSSSARVDEALRQLHNDDVIALDDDGRLWLAHPFSARTEAFRVDTGEKRWDAICVWDAVGILTLVNSDGKVTTRCPDCAEPLRIEVSNGEASAPADYAVHFGVPARRWYEDIAFT